MSRTIPSSPSPMTSVPARTSRSWAVAGLVAALGSFTSVVLSMALSPEYDPGNVITSEQINAALMTKQPLMIAFHVVTLVSGLLMIVFAAGLHRRLHRTLPTISLLPMVAFAGLLLVAVSQVLGTGLDTQFLFGVEDTAINLPGDIGFYSHWIATIPWLWVGGGLAAIAVGVAWRAGAVPTWLGVVGFIFGSLTLLIALSPLQYLAAGPGVLWLLLTSIGFVAGDRSIRWAHA